MLNLWLLHSFQLPQKVTGQRPFLLEIHIPTVVLTNLEAVVLTDVEMHVDTWTLGRVRALVLPAVAAATTY